VNDSQTLSHTVVIFRLILLSAIFPLSLFPFAGRWDWPMAWALVGLMAIATVLSRLLLLRVHPDLLDERAASLHAEDAKPWDRMLAPAMGLTPLLVLMVGGLDDRFQWPGAFPVGGQLAGLLVVLLGYVLATWAMLANRFFSGVVRIQTERDHRVVESGPYAMVRHPGYSGTLLAALGFPLVLSSVWAFLPLIPVFVVTIVRTRLEDETLQAELPDYDDYTKTTRYRLFPGLW